MRRHHIFKRLPTPHALLESRFLKPFSRYLSHHALWQFNRRGVARGTAIGLFFGILSPFGQIALSAVAAFFLRANLPVAAFATFITNPFTTVGVYYCAYLVGGLFMHPEKVADAAEMESDIQLTLAVQEEAMRGWLQSGIEWAQAVGFQLVIGLCILSVVTSILGYFAVSGSWHYWVRRRWRQRRLRQA